MIIIIVESSKPKICRAYMPSSCPDDRQKQSEEVIDRGRPTARAKVCVNSQQVFTYGKRWLIVIPPVRLMYSGFYLFIFSILRLPN